MARLWEIQKLVALDKLEERFGKFSLHNVTDDPYDVHFFVGKGDRIYCVEYEFIEGVVHVTDYFDYEDSGREIPLEDQELIEEIGDLMLRGVI